MEEYRTIYQRFVRSEYPEHFVGDPVYTTVGWFAHDGFSVPVLPVGWRFTSTSRSSTRRRTARRRRSSGQSSRPCSTEISSRTAKAGVTFLYKRLVREPRLYQTRTSTGSAGTRASNRRPTSFAGRTTAARSCPTRRGSRRRTAAPRPATRFAKSASRSTRTGVWRSRDRRPFSATARTRSSPRPARPSRRSSKHSSSSDRRPRRAPCRCWRRRRR